MRILLAVLLFIPILARADLLLEGGYFLSSYAEARSETSIKVNVGYKGLPVYVFGGYEEPELHIRGQAVFYGDVYTAGVGVRHDWGRLSAFMEFGIGILDGDDGVFAQNEVIFTQLVDNHNTHPSRPIPLKLADIPYATHPDTRTEYDIDDAWLGRVGVGYQLFKHLKVTAAYRWMTADEYIAIWDVEYRAAGGGFWEETNPRKLDAFEVGFLFTW